MASPPHRGVRRAEVGLGHGAVGPDRRRGRRAAMTCRSRARRCGRRRSSTSAMSWSTSRTPRRTRRWPGSARRATRLSRGVEAGGRLVEQQHRRVGDAGAGDRHQLALALAQLAGRSVAERRRCRRCSSARRHLARCRSLARGAEGRDADVLLDASGRRRARAPGTSGRARVGPGRAAAGRSMRGAARGGPCRRPRAKPVMASITLVLPAPFGPMSPTTVPGATSQRDVVDGDDAAVAHRAGRATSRSGRAPSAATAAHRRRLGVGAVGRRSAPSSVRRRRAAAAAASASVVAAAARPSGLPISVTIEQHAR